MPQNFFYDFRIFWEMTEQKFTYICNCPKMTEYYVNAPKWPKIKKNTTNTKKGLNVFFWVAPMTLEYLDKYENKTLLLL